MVAVTPTSGHTSGVSSISLVFSRRDGTLSHVTFILKYVDIGLPFTVLAECKLALRCGALSAPSLSTHATWTSMALWLRKGTLGSGQGFVLSPNHMRVRVSSEGIGHDSSDFSFTSVVLLSPECKFKRWLTTCSYNGKILDI